MAIKKELLEKLRNPFNILTIFTLSLGLATILLTSPWQKILGALFLTSLICLLLIFIASLSDWYMSRPTMRVYKNWEEAPKKYRVEETLKDIAKRKGKLEIVARTCFRWLCGNENYFKIDQSIFNKEQNHLQEMLINSIRSGAFVHFVLQNPNVAVPFFTQKEKEKLREHAKASINSYETIYNRLNSEEQQRLILSYTNDIIENSMVRLTQDSKITRIVFDLGIKFRTPKPISGSISKPFIVIESADLNSGDFNDEFNYILNKSISKNAFEEKREEFLNQVRNTIQEFPHHSALRKDASISLASIAARNYLASYISDNDYQIPEPTSIQLLVTNQCTTKCIMCNHHKLYREAEELNDDEITCVLDMIHDMGTRSVIISGGEPLARESLFTILSYAKRIGLNIGLLTNGVKPNAESIQINDARIIADTCSWVQISIDSFNPKTYEHIRRENYLDVVLTSLRSLNLAGLRNIEVCVTIQKDNIEEVIGMIRERPGALPDGVPLRFKFAHGPIYKRNFLFSRRQLDSLIASIPNSEFDHSNCKYLVSMLMDQHFDRENLPKGRPLEAKMKEYHKLSYKCQVLRLTCKIDANGDVYPCCFLFDDNLANSLIRDRYFLGSLRSENIGRVLSPYTHSADNLLDKIWRKSERLYALREHILPVDMEACIYCTRHFYQNEFMNRLWSLFKEGEFFGLAKEISEHRLSETKRGGFWI